MLEATEENNYQVETIQHDYRRVFSTILQDWLGAASNYLDMTFYDNTTNSGFGNFKIDNLINAQNKVPPECYRSTIPIEPSKSILELTIYPNPTSDFVYISAPIDIDIYTVNLYAVNGKYNGTYRNPVASSDFVIDVQSLSTGEYILRIETKTGTKIKKLIVWK